MSNPVRIVALLGTQMEFVQKQFASSAPSLLILSMFSVGQYSASRDP